MHNLFFFFTILFYLFFYFYLILLFYLADVVATLPWWRGLRAFVRTC